MSEQQQQKQQQQLADDIRKFETNFSYYLCHPHTGNPVVAFERVNSTAKKRNLVVKCLVPLRNAKNSSCCVEVVMDGFGVGNFEVHHILSTHADFAPHEILKTRLTAVVPPPKQGALNFGAARLTNVTPEIFATAAAIGCLPLSFTETLWFRFIWYKLFGEAALSKLPSRYLVTKAVDSLAKNAVHETSNALHRARGGSSYLCPLSISLDFWSSRQGVSFFCCIGRVLSPSWEIEEHVLTTVSFMGSHNAEKVAQCLNDIPLLSEIPKALRSLTSDGGSDIAKMQRMNNLAYCDEQYFINCVNHKLHTIITDALMTVKTKSRIPIYLDTVIKAFSSSGLRQQKLAIEMANMNKMPLKILMHVPNRWNSLAISWNRVLKEDVFNAIVSLSEKKGKDNKFILKFRKAQREKFVNAVNHVAENRASILVVANALMDVMACSTALQRQNGITLSRAFFVLTYCGRLFQFIAASKSGFANEFATSFNIAFTGDPSDQMKSERYKEIPLIFRAAAFIDPETHSFWSSEMDDVISTKSRQHSSYDAKKGLLNLPPEEKTKLEYAFLDSEVKPLRDFVIERAKILYEEEQKNSVPQIQVPSNSQVTCTSTVARLVASRLQSAPSAISSFTPFNTAEAEAEFGKLHVALLETLVRPTTVSEFYSRDALALPILKPAIRSILSQPATAANVEAFWSFMGRQDGERRPLHHQRLSNLGLLGVTLRKQVEDEFLMNGIDVPGYLRKESDALLQEKGKLAIDEKSLYLKSRMVASEIIRQGIKKLSDMKEAKNKPQQVNTVLSTELVKMAEGSLDVSDLAVDEDESSEHCDDDDEEWSDDSEDNESDDGETEGKNEDETGPTEKSDSHSTERPSQSVDAKSIPTNGAGTTEKELSQSKNVNIRTTESQQQDGNCIEKSSSASIAGSKRSSPQVEVTPPPSSNSKPKMPRGKS